MEVCLESDHSDGSTVFLVFVYFAEEVLEESELDNIACLVDGFFVHEQSVNVLISCFNYCV